MPTAVWHKGASLTESTLPLPVGFGGRVVYASSVETLEMIDSVCRLGPETLVVNTSPCPHPTAWAVD